tara:strand:- start:88 stop:1161 length:1074 start_codon:yes stop_codon:yes gene_type:complete
MSKAAELANLIGNINMGGGGANKNVIINGAMNVSQRATSATGLGSSDPSYQTLDRFRMNIGGTSAGRFTMAQDSSAPEGFANSLKLSCTTADTSIAADELLSLQQRIEGQNLQMFAKGTTSAKPYAVSFYVKGNASATYTCELEDGDNSRRVAKEFSVTTDWARVELSFPKDTTGAFDDDNALSLSLNIFLHGGSNFTSGTFSANTWESISNTTRLSDSQTSFFDSTDRTFFITGVQLEVGQNPTSFEHEPFATTLPKCERYFQLNTATGGETYSTNIITTSMTMMTEMRAAPTMGAFDTSNAGFVDIGAATRALTQIHASDFTDKRGGSTNLGIASTRNTQFHTMRGSMVSMDAEL